MTIRRWITITRAQSLIYWSCPGGCKEINWSNEVPIGKVCDKCQISYVGLELQGSRLLIEVHYENNNG